MTDHLVLAAALAAARVAFDRIAVMALEMGGTVAGEHGIGLLKVDLLEAELDPVAAQLHRDIKRVLDPAGIMNPGKVFRTVVVSAKP